MAKVAQSEVRQTPIKNAPRVVHLAMANQVDAVGGHSFKSTLG
jgi:hypothetical protein